MNLTYVEHYINSIMDGSPEFILIKLRELVLSIMKYKEEEDTAESVQSILRVVENYHNLYLNLTAEYLVIDKANLSAQAYKAREILAILSLLDTYMLTVVSRENKITAVTNKFNNGNDTGELYKIAVQLRAKKEHYNKEKYSWQNALKSITSELDKTKVLAQYKMMKMKNED